MTTSEQINDENNRSFLFNQSSSAMDIDTNELIPSNLHGHLTPLHPIENGLTDEQEKKSVHRLG